MAQETSVRFSPQAPNTAYLLPSEIMAEKRTTDSVATEHLGSKGNAMESSRPGQQQNDTGAWTPNINVNRYMDDLCVSLCHIGSDSLQRVGPWNIPDPDFPWEPLRDPQWRLESGIFHGSTSNTKKLPCRGSDRGIFQIQTSIGSP